jgi:4-hydroxybenzoate polyprenyltransferase
MLAALMSPVPSPFDWSSIYQADALGRPLCVDLDGTLIGTDTLWESVVLLFRNQPWLIFVAPFWLLSGRARFKQAVAGRVSLNAAALPYREDLLIALKESRVRGRKLILATAADHQVAERIAAHLSLFDDVFASDGQENLKAHAKRERLKSAYGEGGFDYVGDSSADMAIFEAAARGYLVSASATTSARAVRLGKVAVVSQRPSVLRALIKQLRLHQWAKNALVVLPVLLAPEALELRVLLHAAIAALAFSLCASAGYVFNDLLDLEADRAHTTKKNRPLASGALPVVMGPPLFVALLAASFGMSLVLLPVGFTAMLALYFVGTLSYSFYLKKRLLLDVLVLAGLYTHRILAGGIATAIPISAWLLGFSMFFFLSLAFAKRFVELAALQAEKIKNRNYYKADLQMVTSMGTASGYIAALVFSLYVDNADNVATTYREPGMLFLIVPVLLYWISRVWMLAGRGELQDDPVKFALKDSISLLCGVIVGAIAISARFTPSWLSALLH